MTDIQADPRESRNQSPSSRKSRIQTAPRRQYQVSEEQDDLSASWFEVPVGEAMRNIVREQWSGELVDRLGRLFRDGAVVGVTERELIERFVRDRDDAAFEALLARHGQVVLGVCRQLLRDSNDVDDAFQAVFLVLVRKACTLRDGELLGNWLYGVAHRVARRARALEARRAARVPRGTETIEALDAAGQERSTALASEPMPWLHEEVARLPEKYRVAVLLCYFEGLTHDEAAQQLGCPLGTLKGRVSRARDLLRRRLTRRGVTLPTAALSAALAAPEARATVSAPLQHATLKAARTFASTSGGGLVTPSISPTILHLVNGASRDMAMKQFGTFASLVLTLSTVAAGVVGVALGLTQAQARDSAREADARPAASSDEIKPQADFAKRATTKAAIPAKNANTASNERAPDAALDTSNGDVRTIDDEEVIGGWRPGARRRFDIAELAALLTVCEKDPKSQALVARLEEPVSMPFARPTPLADVIKHIKAETAKSDQGPLPIYVDPEGLQNANGNSATRDMTVTIDLDRAPLKTSLRLLLKQVGLAYCIRDGVIIIGSVQRIREELAEAARELVGAGNEEINLPTLARMGIMRGRASGPPGGMMRGGFPAGGLRLQPEAVQGQRDPANDGANKE